MPGSRLGAEEGEDKQGVSIDCGREVWDTVGGIWEVLFPAPSHPQIQADQHNYKGCAERVLAGRWSRWSLDRNTQAQTCKYEDSLPGAFISHLISK